MIVPSMTAVMGVCSLPDDLLADGSTGHHFGLCDLRLGEHRSGRDDPAIGAGIGYAVSLVVAPSRECNRALRPDLAPDLAGDDEAVEFLDRLFDLSLTLADGLSRFQFGIAWHRCLLSIEIESTALGLALRGDGCPHVGCGYEINRAGAG